MFDCLCTLPEYYSARGEAETVERHAEEIAVVLEQGLYAACKQRRRRPKRSGVLGLSRGRAISQGLSCQARLSFHAQGHFTVQYLEPVALEKEESCTTRVAC